MLAYLDAANLLAVGCTALRRMKDAQSYVLGWQPSWSTSPRDPEMSKAA